MCYLFDAILNRPFSNLLNEGEEGLLTAIYERMATMDPLKGNLLHSLCVSDNANDLLAPRSAHDLHLEK
jgi:hypothetical protein